MRNHNDEVSRAVMIPLCALFCAHLALAQSAGQLKGKVVDDRGRSIIHTQIIVSDSSSRYKVEADENGDYQIRLPPGEYQVIVEERPGFAQYRRAKVQVKHGKSTVLNITPESRVYYEDCDKRLIKP